MSNYFLAIDLGASSGRAVLGRLNDDRLALSEVHRFANGPVTVNHTMRWDAPHLEREIRLAVDKAREQVGRLAGVGVDSWGVDYVLTDEAGRPVEPPYHYRDSRTDGAIGRVCKRVGRDKIFKRTGIQFLPFNTIFQLACHDAETLGSADRLLMIADYFAYRLGEGGKRRRRVGEVTLASTSQLLDPRTRDWADDLVEAVGLPRRLLPRLTESGAVLGDCEGVPVIASAGHDTAAAVAGTPAAGGADWAFLSCGTWSILGAELPEPVLTDAALAAGLSNEAGVGGATRLLRNIMGLWLVQECRRAWSAGGRDYGWDELVGLAEAAAPFAAVLDADDTTFMAPENMPEAIAAFCRRTGQSPPDGVGATVRVVLEALALKTRLALEGLESVTGRSFGVIHVVGGGVNNRLLCQWTADATGRAVLAGPVEATSTGNLLAQAVGAGVVASWPDARAIVRRSIELAEYQPRPTQRWDDALGRLKSMIEP